MSNHLSGLLEHDEFVDQKICDDVTRLYFERQAGHWISSNIVEFYEDELPSTLSEIKELIDIRLAEAGCTDLVFLKVWIVKSEAVDTDKTKLPYVFHFDLHRRTKAMLYLTDVGVDDGPLTIDGRLFEEADIGRAKGNNLIPGPALKYTNPRPVLGNAGKLTLFDTNMPHRAGVVLPGRMRLVARFDYHFPNDNRRFKDGDLMQWLARCKRRVRSYVARLSGLRGAR